jgi:signal transduction histidine kinase
LQSLMEYIAHFANELFDGNSTRCRLDLPGDLPGDLPAFSLPLPPDMRHNIFLIVKEALTNALKHAGAKEVQVQAKVSGHRLEIRVVDDGRGFDLASPTEGRNGMGNMRRRAAAMNAKLDVQSAPGKGTAVTLSVVLGNEKKETPA